MKIEKRKNKKYKDYDTDEVIEVMFTDFFKKNRPYSRNHFWKQANSCYKQTKSI